MSGVPPNVIPVNAEDLSNNLVSGVTTQAQQAAAEAVGQLTGATGAATAAANAAVAQAQAQAMEQLNSLAQKLQLPPDAIAALAILQTLFSYEELALLDIEEIKRRIKAIKLAFKLSRPKLPEIPKLPIPSIAETIDNLIPKLPNDSGLDAFGDKIINEIKQLRQEAQSKFEKDAANRAKNMFQLRQELVQAESQKLLSGLLAKANLPSIPGGTPPSLPGINLPTLLG